jgi:4-amino-4-deoxy-L-arabinose transferase-like glycosyltransferase
MSTSIFFFILSEEQEKNSRFILLSGLFFGLAFLTKQSVALLIPLIVAPYLVLKRRSIKSLFTKQFALFLGIGFLVICPWLIYMILQYGSQFWYVFLLYNNVLRSMSPLEGHVGDFLFYLNYLVTRENVVWVASLPFALALSVFKLFRKRSNQDMLLVVWIAAVLGVFTIVQTKLFWYILPVFPAFAIMIAAFLYSLARRLNLLRKNLRS